MTLIHSKKILGDGDIPTKKVPAVSMMMRFCASESCVSSRLLKQVGTNEFGFAVPAACKFFPVHISRDAFYSNEIPLTTAFSES